MPTKREKITKNGRHYYEFRVKPSRNEPEHTMRWYFPEGVSRKTIEKLSDKALFAFDEEVHNGTHQTKQQKKASTAQKAADAAKQLSFDDYVKKIYFPNAALSENAYSSFESQLRVHVSPIIGDKNIKDITSDDINYVLAVRRTERCAYSTVIKLYTILHVIFAVMHKEHPGANPMLLVERPKEKSWKEVSAADIADGNESFPSDDGIKKAYTLDESIRILNAIQLEPLKWRLYISMLYDTGIRRGECTAIKWSVINMDTGDIEIEMSVGVSKRKGIYFTLTKGKRKRTVTVSPGTLKMLKEWKLEQEQRGIISDFVFTQDDSSKIMYPTSPTAALERIGKRCGIDRFHPHKLRHTFASIGITNGADIASISELLGHSDINTTLRFYTHGNEDSKHKVSREVHSIIHGKNGE